MSLQSHLWPRRLRGTSDSRTIFPRGEGSATRRLDNRLLGEGGGDGGEGCTPVYVRFFKMEGSLGSLFSRLSYPLKKVSLAGAKARQSRVKTVKIMRT